MNKTLIFLLFFLLLIQIAPCAVTLRMTEPNGLLDLPSQEIILGKSIALVVHASDPNDHWKGGIFLRDQDRNLATLRGRGSIPNSRECPDSCLSAAGDHARVMEWEDSYIEGYDLYPDDVNREAGDWFVIEYIPQELGLCKVEFYDYIQDPNDWNEPHSILVLENTPSRDFTGNGIVNLKDYMRFTQTWLEEDCTDPNWCNQTDLDRDGWVGLNDLLMFSEHWLWGTLGWKPALGPADPNVYYNITDTYGMNEITTSKWNKDRSISSVVFWR